MFKLFDQFHFLEYVVGVVDNLVYGSTRLPILEYNNILLQNLYVMVILNTNNNLSAPSMKFFTFLNL